MKYNVDNDVKNYVFCVEKQRKDGFSFEAKARNFLSGKFYAVRFNGRKKYNFFIFSNRQWKVYFMNRNSKYYPSAFKSTQDFICLENDIITGSEIPELLVRGTKVKKYHPRGGTSLELPEFPFLYVPEIRKLDPETQKRRYHYSQIPKYLITARKSKYVKPDAAQSLYIFGCNNDELYKKISVGSSICVTHTYENEKAVAVSKCVNSYNIIPLQHCLKAI